MTESQDKVLAIPELFECILLHLPMKDLLLAQRVSKAWRYTIITSISIQRALFLAPEPPISPNGERKPEINPFFEDIMEKTARGLAVGEIQTLQECQSYGYDVVWKKDTLFPLPPCEHDFHVHLYHCSTV